jgi:hypothetical protein
VSGRYHDRWHSDIADDRLRNRGQLGDAVTLAPAQRLCWPQQDDCAAEGDSEGCKEAIGEYLVGVSTPLSCRLFGLSRPVNVAAIVAFAFRRIAEDSRRLRDLPEAVRSGGIAASAIRMFTLGQRIIGVADLIPTRYGRHANHGV